MPSELHLSVVICTRNPPHERLSRVLEGLRMQRLDRSKWSLLIIDNGSEPAIEAEVGVKGHPEGSVYQERISGLTHARLAGIRETKGHLLFVDDDNVLEPTYLEHALDLLERKPWVGAFGGSVCLEFESEPPAWTRMFYGMLAERLIERDVWSNIYLGSGCVPCGAGMVVRREVAEQYYKNLSGHTRRMSMDRMGESLVSDGDTDLALTACDLGLACGQFSGLKLWHLIPESRLDVGYLSRLAHGMAYSGMVLRSLRRETQVGLTAPSKWERLRHFIQSIRLSREQRVVRNGWERGMKQAFKELENSGWKWKGNRLVLTEKL